MFTFTKFFNGRKALSVENIDHDRVTELIFETMPQIKDDKRWGFAVTRFVPVLLLLLALGCATGNPYREEMVREMSLEEQLNAHIDDYYDQVVGLCTELQRQAVHDQGPVGCLVRGSAMHLSFPSKAYHDDSRYFEDIGRLYQHWCAASGSKLGRQGTWVRYFRQEKTTQSMPCRAKQTPTWPKEKS